MSSAARRGARPAMIPQAHTNGNGKRKRGRPRKGEEKPDGKPRICCGTVQLDRFCSQCGATLIDVEPIAEREGGGRWMPYVRVSTDRQELSLIAQQERVRKAHAYEIDMERVGAETAIHAPFVDQDTSRSLPLFERPAGRRMLMELRRGDTVVVTRFDRAFGGPHDALGVINVLNRAGVSLTILDQPGFDTATPIGQMLVAMLGTIARIEIDAASQRTRDVQQSQRERGFATAAVCNGWKHAGEKGRKRYVVFQEERDRCELIVALHDYAGFDFSQISRLFMRRETLIMPARRQKDSCGAYHPVVVIRHYKAAKAGYPRHKGEVVEVDECAARVRREELLDSYLPHWRDIRDGCAPSPV